MQCPPGTAYVPEWFFGIAVIDQRTIVGTDKHTGISDAGMGTYLQNAGKRTTGADNQAVPLPVISFSALFMFALIVLLFKSSVPSMSVKRILLRHFLISSRTLSGT